MLILTLETTCDETAAAVVTGDLQILSSVVASQEGLHQQYRGVVPELAARAHVERILPVVDEALRRAQVSLNDLSAIAVANTPGLAGSLLVSGFYATDLDLLLRCLGCNAVILTGIATDGCVQATAIDAQARDYYVRVVRDATATTNQPAFEAALTAMSRMQPGVVVESQEILLQMRVAA